MDDQPDTQRLRADIYWESGNWEVAGQKAEELLGTRWSDADAPAATLTACRCCAWRWPIRWPMTKPAWTGCASISRPR